MPRLLAAALAALLLLPGAARAQAAAAPRAAPDEKPAPAEKSPPPEKPASAEKPVTAEKAAQPEVAPELDARTKEAIQKAVEKAKDDLRNEVRAEIQGAQSAAEFMGAVAEGPKLQFLQLDGYFRVRGQLFDDFALRRSADASGHFLFPVPLQGGATLQSDGTYAAKGRSTFSDANMRLRLEPTINVSEHVRVKAQVDVLDNYVLGSSDPQLWDQSNPLYPAPLYGSSRRLTANDPVADRAPILPKRAWAEVQTPVGLLSFGRMPSEWGLGMLTTAGGGIDDDLGDTFDRIQFALPLSTPLGSLTLVPILDFDNTGPLYTDPHQGAGVGQPFVAESGSSGRTYAIKVARIDTPDEIRRKLERGDTSVSFGGYYNYRTQRYNYPTTCSTAVSPGNAISGSTSTSCADAPPSSDVNLPVTPSPSIHTSAYAHVFDGWFRILRPRWRIELEAAGVVGSIGQASVPGLDGAGNPISVPVGKVNLDQWGLVLQGDYQAIPGKLLFGGEFGIASADSAPGFGTGTPSLVDTTYLPISTPLANGALPPYGSFQGPQYGQAGDHSITNFRFNPAYRVDMILFRYLLGEVTEAWYLKPRVRWDVLPGLHLDGAVIYSQALNGGSVPAAVSRLASVGTGPASDAYVLQKAGPKPLGLELDTKLTLETGEGFIAWGDMAVLQPLGGLGPGASRAWYLGFGLAAKF
ncbi:MAG TPA: TIGR04551 family protein [Anaeromyxobacter sp.]|nr:TIGR04551 family protein [Anaeromyxobacter sp.]